MNNLIYAHHRKEWQESAIAQELIEANLRSLKVEPYGARDEAIALLENLDNVQRDNTGRISRSVLNRYQFLNDGGWYAYGFDLKTGKRSDFVCLKSDHPRWDKNKQKPIKYEHRRGQATEIFVPAIPLTIANQIFWGVKGWEKFRDNYDGDPEFTAWAFALKNGVPVGITEGFKKAASVISQGKLCVAVPGIWNWIDQDAEKFFDFKGKEKRRKELTQHLTPLCRVKREFFLAFDEDSKPSTRHNVNRAQEMLGKALSKNGGKVSILSWESKDGKGIDDAIAANGKDWFNDIFNSRLSLSTWLYWNQQLSHVDRKLHKNFLTKEDISSNAKLLGLKSPKGTGKTKAIAEYIEEYIKQGKPVLLLSHRVQLVKELSERFGIDNAYNFRISETKGILGLALCVDSMHSESQVQFNPDNWDDFILIMDEVEQVIPHTLISTKTDVAKHRTEVLANLAILCQNASQIILSDADLSDRAFNYIRSLTGNCSQYIIQNDYQPAKGRKLYNYDTPEAWLEALMKKLENGEKILIPTDAQQARSTWGAQTLESMIKKIYSDLRLLRVDATTIENPEHEAEDVIEDLCSILCDYDVVIYTSVLGTGVDIDLEGHFDAVFSINQGTQSENSTRQFLARLRDDVPRHCYFKPIGVGFIGGGETNSYEVFRSQKAQVKQNLSNLGKLEKSPLDFDGDHCKTYAHYVANHNLSMSAYREIVLEGLRQEGYEILNVENLDNETRKCLREETKKIRDENYDNETSAIAQTKTPSDSELNALENQQKLTDSERYQLRKGKMQQNYGVEADQELVKQDDNGLYSKLCLLFWLTVGRDRVAEVDKQKAENYSEKTGGKGYEPDFNRTQNQAKVQVLEALRIPEILTQPGEITNDSLVWWWEHIKYISQELGARKTVKRYLGITLSDRETPIRNLGKILNRIGLQLTLVKQLGHKHDRARVYRIDQITDKQDAIFSHWQSQIEEKLAKGEEIETAA